MQKDVHAYHGATDLLSKVVNTACAAGVVTRIADRTAHAIAIVGTEGHASQRWIAKAIGLNRHTCMKIRASVESLSFFFFFLSSGEWGKIIYFSPSAGG